jgi:hypothetical protein
LGQQLQRFQHLLVLHLDRSDREFRDLLDFHQRRLNPEVLNNSKY